MKVPISDRARPLGDILLELCILGEMLGAEVGASNLTRLLVLLNSLGAFSVVILESLSNGLYLQNK